MAAALIFKAAPLMQSSPSSYLERIGYALTLLLPVGILAGNAAGDIIVSLLAFFFLISCTREKKWCWLREGWVRIALGLWFYMMVRNLLVGDIDAFLSRAAAWIRFPLGAVALAYWTLRSRLMQKHLLVSLALCVSFLIADTLFQYFMGTDIFGRTQILVADIYRLTGPLSGPRVGIMIAWLIFPLLFVVFMGEEKPPLPSYRTLVGGSITVVAIATVFLTGERMAFLLLCMGLGCMLLLLPISKKWLLGIFALAFFSLLILSRADNDLIDRQVLSTVESVKYFEETPYGKIWQSAITIIRENPLFGVGLKQFSIACADTRYGSGANIPIRCNLHPHNFYLEWLVQTGFVGLGLFLWMVVECARTVLRARPWLPHKAIYWGLLIALCLRLWPIAGTPGFHAAWSALPFWLFLGWLMAITLCATAPLPRRHAINP